MNNYTKTIGIEVHTELKTKEKIFSNSLNRSGDTANTNINEIDLGYPGTLPTLNKEVIDLAIIAATVLNCTITKKMHFDRKNYFYPDNPKNFQITQSRTPIGTNGYVMINVDGTEKRIDILEMHIEEDTCKSIHGNNSTLLDFNRAGVPLIEIVTEPCMHSSEEAVLYLEALRELLLYAGISDCKIEEGSMRCDANISISNTEFLGTKVEVKNIGSISNVGLAIEYEANRQEELLKNNDKIIEETRRFDDKNNQTISMRVKETGNDYRYFPEPDIPYLILEDDYIKEVQLTIPRLASVRKKDYLESGLALINANKIIANIELSNYLEQFDSNFNYKIASNLLLGDISGYLNKKNLHIFDTKLTKDKFEDLVEILDKGEINNKIFKEILIDLMESDKLTMDIIKDKGINIVNDDNLVVEIINKVINDNPSVIDDYKKGNDRSLKFLMGQVMKESKGQLDPSRANNKLIEILNKD